MNLLPEVSRNLAHDLVRQIKRFKLSRKTEIVLCPSFESLASVQEELRKSGIALGAQDAFWQSEGAFTGEISAVMLKDVGCKYIIVGHSERRKYLLESNEMINRKVHAVLESGLTPILCVGETIEERREHQQDLTVMTQIMEGLGGINLQPEQEMIIAYEPVWVIGTGQAIDAYEADRMSQVIRQALIDLMPLPVVENQTRIIYGGSTDADNIQSFLNCKLIQGVLVGSASLSTNKFIPLLKSVI